MIGVPQVLDDKSALFVNSKRLALVRYAVNEQKLRGVFRTSALPPKADMLVTSILS